MGEQEGRKGKGEIVGALGVVCLWFHRFKLKTYRLFPPCNPLKT
jgi:hypothetical protein